jgi:hypothetical protein
MLTKFDAEKLLTVKLQNIHIDENREQYKYFINFERIEEKRVCWPRCCYICCDETASNTYTGSSLAKNDLGSSLHGIIAKIQKETPDLLDITQFSAEIRNFASNEILNKFTDFQKFKNYVEKEYPLPTDFNKSKP